MTAFAGTSSLLRLALRRDRLVLLLWVVILAALPALFALAFARDLPTQADVLRETRLMAGNAGFRMLSLSPGASVGAYAMNRGFVTVAILAAGPLLALPFTAGAEEPPILDLLWKKSTKALRSASSPSACSESVV